MDRSTIRDSVSAMYEARTANDAEATMACFAPDAEIRVAGSPEHSGIAAVAQGEAQLASLVMHMVEVWQFRSWTELSLQIDGDTAAVRYDFTVCHGPSGQEVETQAMDHLAFDDRGRIRLYVTYLDTALARHLDDPAPALSAR